MRQDASAALAMTTTTPTARAQETDDRHVYFSALLGRPLEDQAGQRLGRLADIIVRLHGARYPLVTGMVARVGRRHVFVPAAQAGDLAGSGLRLASATVDLRRFERRDGEVLLRGDVLGHRLIDIVSARLVRARDLRLSPGDGGWILDAVDTRWHRRLPWTRPARHHPRDWQEFEPLVGHDRTAAARARLNRVRRLKPAQIADLLEEASAAEGTEIMGHVSADPELEADVFEELDEEVASRLLGARTDADIAAVLARMPADEAADTITGLPQPRRQPVLDLLPPGQRAKVRALLAFSASSAGGLMGLDFLALPADISVADALRAVGSAREMSPEALSTVHVVDGEGRLLGTARVVTLLQCDPARRLADVCEGDPVRIGANTDVPDVAVLMTDYNLVTIPVVDAQGRMLGLITVDDVLEVTLPEDWRRREAAEPPDAYEGGNADAAGGTEP
jgi:CBS domain-containing protein